MGYLVIVLRPSVLLKTSQGPPDQLEFRHGPSIVSRVYCNTCEENLSDQTQYFKDIGNVFRYTYLRLDGRGKRDRGGSENDITKFG
jgi:hypothetical protein